MTRFHSDMLIWALLGLFVAPLQAQDPAPDPAPPPAATVTAADVIKARAAAKELHAANTRSRLDAEKALDVARIAEENAAKADVQADALLTRAIQKVGPVVVIDAGKVTVYELNPDGSLRVITPTPADTAPFDEDALPEPNPAPPAPALAPRPGPRAPAAKPRTSFVAPQASASWRPAAR